MVIQKDNPSVVVVLIFLPLRPSVTKSNHTDVVLLCKVLTANMFGRMNQDKKKVILQFLQNLKVNCITFTTQS